MSRQRAGSKMDSKRRVVVTGFGAVSPFGFGSTALLDGLNQGRSAIRHVPELAKVKGLRCHIAGMAPVVDTRRIPRNQRRFMSRMSLFALLACEEALARAEIGPEAVGSGRLGLALGSTVGSPATYQDFFADYLRDFSIERTRSTMFFKIMNHSCAANVAQTLGIRGRMIAPCAACASSLQAVGLGLETIRSGRQDQMLCGGAEELHPLTVATFDIIQAASTNSNDRPTSAPRPFDLQRDGTVCSEGSGVLLLESLESAKRRGVKILAEVFGFATVTDISSISNPDSTAIEACMRDALEDAGLQPDMVEYVNAHATATIGGDASECEAIQRVCGGSVPVSCLKGHLGHALAASGALECIGVIDMLHKERILPTRNLDTIAPDCAGVRHIQELCPWPGQIALKNNFALGGVNSTLLLGRFVHD